jgi:hypothetical protein
MFSYLTEAQMAGAPGASGDSKSSRCPANVVRRKDVGLGCLEGHWKAFRKPQNYIEQ